MLRVYTSLVGVPTKSTKIEPLQIPVIQHTVSKHVLYNVETFHKEEEKKPQITSRTYIRP